MTFPGKSEPRSPGSEAEMGSLSGYRASLRDRVAVVIVNGVLRGLASHHYRDLVKEAISKGLAQMVCEQSPNPPFTQPLDDPASITLGSADPYALVDQFRERHACCVNAERLCEALRWAMRHVPAPKTQHNIYASNYADAQRLASIASSEER